MSNTATISDAEFFRQRGFGLKLGFGRHPALVIVDIIQAFTDPDMPLGSEMGKEIIETNRVIDACREANVPMFFTTTAYDDAALKDGGVWVLKQKGAATLRSGTPAVELDPRLHYQQGDSLLVKKYASCFFGTDLLSRLISHGCDTVLIAGATTSGCVRGTAVDAVQNGFRPIVIKEAVCDRSVAAHEQSLFDLEAKYCDVVPIDEVLDYLKNLNRQ